MTNQEQKKKNIKTHTIIVEQKYKKKNDETKYFKLDGVEGVSVLKVVMARTAFLIKCQLLEFTFGLHRGNLLFDDVGI